MMACVSVTEYLHSMKEGQGKFQRKKFDNLVFGRQPVVELLMRDASVDKILLSKTAQGDVVPQIKQKAAEKNIPIQYVPVEKLNALTGGNHQGVIAFTAAVEFQKIDDVLPFIIEKGEVPLILILDGITDVRNFGAIARTAYASGVHAIIIPAHHTAPINSDAMKTSAGALQEIPICREKNFELVLQYLKLNGLQILGADSQADTYIYQQNLNLPTAIIMGAEDEGMSAISRKHLTSTVKIPMLNTFDSFNVSVATGIILYETTRQRLQ